MQGGRPENQDDFGFLDTPLGFALVVCDGMGGGPGGKTASYIAKYEFLTTLSKCSEQTPPATAMKMAVSRANDALDEKMAQVPELRGMGSTLVGILISKQSAIIAHLGDSRCYQLRGKKVKFRTQDHSLVGELVRSKALTEEQARVSPQSNVITRGLGNTTNHVADIDEVSYQKGDRFVLCTDGVWGIMPHGDLLRRLTDKQDITSKLTSMSAEIDQIGFSDGGHHDNHTLAIIEINTDSILKEKMSKQTKILLAVLSSLLAISVLFNIILLTKNYTRPTNIPMVPYYGGYRGTTISPIPTNVNETDTDKSSGDGKNTGIVDYEDVLKDIANSEKNHDKVVSNGSNVSETNGDKNSTANDTVGTKKSDLTIHVNAASAKEIATIIVNNLAILENLNCNDMKEALKMWDQSIKNISELLPALDIKTKKEYHAQIIKMKERVNGPEFDSKTKIWEKDRNSKNKTYVAAPAARNAAIELTKEINDISVNYK